MERINVNILKCVNGITFGENRENVRNILGRDYKAIKKTPLSVNTMDVYKNFNVYYSESNCMEAVEFFAGVMVVIDDIVVFPGNIKRLQKMFPHLVVDEYGCFIEKNVSIGGTLLTGNNDTIESIIIGCKGYYCE